MNMWSVNRENIEAQECLMCRSKFNQDTNMAYLSKLAMNETFTMLYQGQNDKSGVLLESCNHVIHPECFLTLKQNSQLQYKCPLCSTVCNMVLPCRITKNQLLLRQCENILNSLFVQKYKSLEFESILPLLFRHLIESMGLDSLTRPDQFEKSQNRKNKTNILIITLIFDYLIAY